ncbi:jg27456 [Pararge aegeria aegeria]|uniref:Jg27456 protein n=1 Tax=Pararge aegeria aegeria TaxID=348720 RepID=A0A8S4QP57_9NEOP|nr:jg27456 [Pararge aegeria aegeria]
MMVVETRKARGLYVIDLGLGASDDKRRRLCHATESVVALGFLGFRTERFGDGDNYIRTLKTEAARVTNAAWFKKKPTIKLFADDTSLMFKIKRRELALDDVNNYRAKVVQWFEANNLVLNENKTKCIKFTLPNVKHVKTTILLNNEELNPVDTTVFLGITLDAKLQCGPHVNNLSNRLSSAAYAVKKIRHLTDIETARLVYFSYFHSIMSYGI